MSAKLQTISDCAREIIKHFGGDGENPLEVGEIADIIRQTQRYSSEPVSAKPEPPTPEEFYAQNIAPGLMCSVSGEMSPDIRVMSYSKAMRFAKAYYNYAAQSLSAKTPGQAEPLEQRIADRIAPLTWKREHAELMNDAEVRNGLIFIAEALRDISEWITAPAKTPQAGTAAPQT